MTNEKHASRAALTSSTPAQSANQAQATSHEPRITVRRLGRIPYEQAWEAMRTFTSARTPETADELWLLEHPPVYTYGVAGRPEHLPPADCGIQLIKVDRGGQVTYHGPGQLILYALIDLRRRGLGVRDLVRLLEQAVIDLLESYGILAQRQPGAPGVYVAGAKIAALGLRIRSGCSYHGLSLNVDIDLAPFESIDPCGYPGLPLTRTRDLGISDASERLGERLVQTLVQQLGAAEEHP